MTAETRGHVFPKWGPRGPFRVYSWLQAAITVAGLVMAALMLVAGMAGPALVLVLILGALTLRDSTGLPVWTRVGRGLRSLLSGWTGSRIWSRASEADSPRWLTGTEVSGFELPHGVIGVVCDRGRYLAGMRVHPTRDPWLQSRADREVSADDWARVVTSIPFESVDRLQVVTVSRQGGGDDLLADAASAEGHGADAVAAVASFLAKHVRQAETVVVIRLSHQVSRDALRRGGMVAVGRLLHASLQHLGSQLPPEQLQAEILAPADWSELFDSVLHVSQVNASDIGVPVPSRVEERWSTVTVDETVHRMLWLWQWPQRPMAAGFLAPLLTGGGNRVVSILVAPSDPEPQQRALDWAYRRAESAAETARSGKHRKQAELESLDRQLRELNQGHIPVRVLAVVSVSAETLEEVDDLTGAVRSNAVAGSCRVAPFLGRQLAALSWVLPLCRGLDKGVDG